MKLFIKIAVAIVLISVLLRGVDWQQAAEITGSVTWWVLAVVLLVMFLELILSAWKWSWSLRMHDLTFGLNYLFRAVAVGMFLNNFLPTSIGGDAYRVYRTLPLDGYRSRAISAVAVERLVGLGALLALGGVGALAVLSEFAIARLYLIVLMAGGIAALLLGYAIYRGWFKPLTDRVRHLAVFDALNHNLGRLLAARREWVHLLALSFLYQCGSILIVYYLFHAVGYPVPLAWCALITAAAGVVAVLPISINGIGLMEGSIVGMAVALGVTYEYALLVALVRRFVMLALSVLCGLIYALEQRAPSPQASA